MNESHIVTNGPEISQRGVGRRSSRARRSCTLGAALLGAIFAGQAIGCSASDDPAGHLSARADAPAPQAGSTRGDPHRALVPVTTKTEYNGKAISSWGVELQGGERSVLSALGPRNDVVFRLEIQRVGDDVLVTAEHGAEKHWFRKSGVVETVVAPAGPSRLAATAGLKGDVDAWRRSSVVAYDCNSSTAVAAAALLAMVAACATPEPAEPAACLIMAAAYLAALYAANQDCQPQNCTADWQCTDKFGPDYSCQQGACVHTTVTMIGCRSDADCDPGYTCDVASGNCYFEDLGGGGGGCASDDDCGNGGCDWYTNSCGS